MVLFTEQKFSNRKVFHIMKAIMRTSVVILAVALFLMLGQVQSASAQDPAYQTAFTTSITYQNVGTASATIQILFYSENSGTAITIDRDPLAPDAGASVFVGSLDSLGSSFTGSAVLTSDQPVVATMVQVPSSDTVKNRPLSNGFSSDSGATEILLATTLKNRFNSTTVFSIQNISGSAVNVEVKFYDASDNGSLAHTETHNGLPAGAAKYYDLGNISEIPDNFNGSATISANGNIVAAAQELSINGTGASSFEGVNQGATTVYMPSAICNAFGGQNSAYAVQNTSATQANVTVTYSSGNTATAQIGSGAKASFQGCNSGGNADGFSGSATITSDQAIIAIGKVFGNGLSTAFLGEAAGFPKLALPYVRWSETQYDSGVRQRTFIAIQNVGGSTASVDIEYRDKDGNLVGTDTISIPAGEKANSKPINVGSAADEFGYVGGFGGGAIVSSPGSQLVAIARVQSKVPADGSTVAEDYNGIPIE
jgi:hypothetical protein